jgi:hypothetical protein
MEKKKVMEFLNGKMALFIKDNFIKIIYMDMENIAGLMEGNLLETGSIIGWKVKVFLLGKMEGNMKANIWTIKNMGMENLNGQMVFVYIYIYICIYIVECKF